ncbi:hypothetical protein AB4Y85_12595 [Microvirga sp. 2YAF29]|uniref:hypothetical protein n=1 Tax=Microvirga sp. 2YAF29 TaxID=3233031 RepID=UPI003F9CEF1B
MHRYRFINRLGLISGAVLAGAAYAATMGMLWLKFYILEDSPTWLRVVVLCWTVVTLLSVLLAIFLAKRWSGLAIAISTFLSVILGIFFALPDEGYEIRLPRVFIGSFIPPILFGLCLGAYWRRRLIPTSDL